MNEALQTLEIKVENNGTTPQGKIFAREWNVLVEAVKALDLKGFDEAKLLQFLRDKDFITSEDIPDVDFSNVVTLSGQQTISGPKDFVGGIKVNGMPLTYNSKLGVWEFTGDLFVTGNFAWGSSIDGFKPSTVMDAVRVDGSTIIKKKDSNGDWYLYAPGGGSGGSGGGLTLGDVVSYLSYNDYTTKTDVNSLIASSLAGYATEQWIANKGYLTSSALNGLASQSWVSDNYLSTSGGAIEGVLELNSTNVARSIRFNTSVGSSWLFVNSGEWYVTNIGWGAEYNLIHSGNIGQQSVNRAASAGAADSANIATRFESVSLGITDLNEYKNTGAYNFHSSVNAPNSYISNMLVLRYSPDWGSQIVFDSEKNIFVRNWRDSGGVFDTNWRTVAFTDSNVASADVLKKSFANEDINYGAGDGLKLIYCHSNPGNFATTYQSGISVSTDYTGWQLTSYGGDVENPYFRSLQDNGVWKPWRILAFLTDNVASATKLQTPRSIWGQSFDGTGNVDGQLDINGLGTLHRDGSALWLNYGGANNNQSLRVCGYDIAFYYGIGSNFTRAITITNGGDVAIGGTTADAKLHVHGTTILGGDTTINGNLLVNGNVSWFSHSQRSLKNIISEQGLSLAQLERIRPIKFYWKDGRDMALHVGGVADVFAEVLPEVVARNHQDILCLNYVDAAFYVGASLIAPVLDHERRITKGEEEQEALKKENAKLKRELEEVKSKLNQLVA